MVVAVLGPVSVGSCFCHQSKHNSVGDVVVLLLSPLVSPSARNRRSARVSPRSKLEVEDDMWDPMSVTQRSNWIFLFSELNE